MKNKFTPKIILEQPKDLKHEYFRAIKTLCIIMIIFCLAIVYQNRYKNMLDNSRFMKFYPQTTVFYQDFKNMGNFSNMQLPQKYQAISYGIVKDDRGKDKFLMVAKTPDKDTPIIDTENYSLFTKDGYTFISNSNEELKNLQKRLETKNYEFIKNKNLINLIKNLDKNRDYTILITNLDYIGIPIDEEFKTSADKIFDKAIIQIYNEKNGIKFKGELTFENDIANIVANIKMLADGFSNKEILIDSFNKENASLIIGIKNFDLWIKAISNFLKTRSTNQYKNTFKQIQKDFNFDIEKDIIQKLNGNAVLYLSEDKDTLAPLIILETKQDLAKEAQKYLGFLQLQNNSKMTEKEVNQKNLTVFSNNRYPHNFSF